MFDLSIFEHQIATLYKEHNNEKIEDFYNKAYEQICKEIDEILKHIIGCCGTLRLPEEYQGPYAYLNKCAIEVLNEQAGFYRGINNWEKCEEAFSNLYRFIQNIDQLDSKNHAIVLLNHATALQMQGNFDAAEKRFTTAKEILEREESKENDYILAGFYNNSAPIYLYKGEPEKALAYQKKAADYLKNSTGLDGEEAATLYSSMAVTSDMCGFLDEAEDYAEKAISIFEKIGGGAHFGAALQAKARIYYHRENYEEAAELFQRAADDTKLYFGENKEYQICIANRDKALRQKKI